MIRNRRLLSGSGTKGKVAQSPRVAISGDPDFLLRLGRVEILLSQDDFAKGRERPKAAGFRLYCETSQDVDELAAEIQRRGGELAHEPTDQPWGARDFGLLDPDGFAFSISTGVTK